MKRSIKSVSLYPDASGKKIPIIGWVQEVYIKYIPNFFDSSTFKIWCLISLSLIIDWDEGVEWETGNKRKMMRAKDGAGDHCGQLELNIARGRAASSRISQPAPRLWRKC